MRCVALIALLCLLLPSLPAFGQPDAEDPDRPNSLVAGMTALQFVIKAEPYRSFSSGVEVAVKRHHSGGGALRLGLDVDWDQSEQTGAETRSDPVNGDVAFDTRTKNDNWSIGGDLLWIGYPVRGGLVNLYWGLGPTAGFARREVIRAQSGDDPLVTERSDRRSSDIWTVGGKALLGLEWFAVERVSVYMEYRAQIVYSSESGELLMRFGDRVGQATIDGTGWNANSSAVLIGFAAYF